ncbi:MAG: aminotransferase class I/II-fold pyridoxal phosphate-dependent enzyme [Bacteroidota bacterium]
MKINFDKNGEVITSYLNDRRIGYLTGDSRVIGSPVSIGGQLLQNFSILDYLCLSTDERLKSAAIEATLKYGLYTGVSRSYMKIDLYEEAEEMVGRVFNRPVVIFTRATLAHVGIFPLIMGKNDVIILDHFVHATMKTASLLMKAQGSRVELVRHNNLNMLEDKIRALKDNHEKIWYCVDGIYSMQGDRAPLKDLQHLLNKYEQFHLLADDSHGMSWTGENGKGAVLSDFDLHPRMIVVSSLGKGYGAGGAVVVCYDNSVKEKIIKFAAPLIYSGTPSPGTLGAIVASAKIHLSDEIYARQEKLHQLMYFTRDKIRELGLPVYSESVSPVNNIMAGNYTFCADITARIKERGYYISPAGYPAVPVNNSSFRVVVSNYHTISDIEALLETLNDEYRKGLEESGLTIEKIRSYYK